MNYIYLQDTYYNKYGQYEKEFYNNKFNEIWKYANISLGFAAIFTFASYFEIRERCLIDIFFTYVFVFFVSHVLKFRKKVKFYSEVTPKSDERIIFLKKILHGNLNNETLDYLINKTLNKKNLLSENDIFSTFKWKILSFISSTFLTVIAAIFSLYKTVKTIMNIGFLISIFAVVIILVILLFLYLISEIRYEKKRCDSLLLLDLESIRYFRDKPIDPKKNKI